MRWRRGRSAVTLTPKHGSPVAGDMILPDSKDSNGPPAGSLSAVLGRAGACTRIGSPHANQTAGSCCKLCDVAADRTPAGQPGCATWVRARRSQFAIRCSAALQRLCRSECRCTLLALKRLPPLPPLLLPSGVRPPTAVFSVVTPRGSSASLPLPRCGQVLSTEKDRTGVASGTCYLLAAGTVTATKHAAGRTLGGARCDLLKRPRLNRPKSSAHDLSPGCSASGGGAVGVNGTGLLGHGRLSAAGPGWSWSAWEADKLNLLGTLPATPSADLAGCCSNKNVTAGALTPRPPLQSPLPPAVLAHRRSAGEYDPKAAYTLQPGLLSVSPPTETLSPDPAVPPHPWCPPASPSAVQAWRGRDTEHTSFATLHLVAPRPQTRRASFHLTLLKNHGLQRAGAALVDDSRIPLLDIPSSNELADSWLVVDSDGGRAQRDGKPAAQDLYVLGCGLDYRGCMKDFVALSGPIALPPGAAPIRGHHGGHCPRGFGIRMHESYRRSVSRQRVLEGGPDPPSEPWTVRSVGARSVVEPSLGQPARDQLGRLVLRSDDGAAHLDRGSNPCLEMKLNRSSFTNKFPTPPTGGRWLQQTRPAAARAGDGHGVA